MTPDYDITDLTPLAGPATQLHVVRSGHTVVLSNSLRRLQVRLFPPDTPADALRRELDVCRYLNRAGFRAPQPAEVPADQPIRLAGTGHWCTIWQLIDGHVVLPGDYARLGTQLRILHAVPPPRGTGTWSPAARIAAWIDVVDSRPPSWLPTGATLALRHGLADTIQRIPEPAVTDRVLCHGDPHPGNLLRTPGGDMLIDYEYAGVGPRAWDLSEIHCHHRRFGLSAADRIAFATGYGTDPIASGGPSAEAMIRLRELMLTTWAIFRSATTGADPGQALLRLRSLDDPEPRPCWSPL